MPAYQASIETPRVSRRKVGNQVMKKTMPAAREAIEQGRWDEANVQLGRIATALNAEAALIRSAKDALEAATK